MPEDAPARVGFVGLGRMGWPMASLLAPHCALTVLDARADVADAFAAEHGATAAVAPRMVGVASDVAITMLPDGRAVREVALGGLGEGLGPGGLLIDMSSSAPAGTRALADELAAYGVALVDAPVSGGVVRARDGSLSVMAGGAPDDVARARPLLERLGRVIYEVGGVGAGHAVKALNNYLSATGLAAACEALLVGQRFGLDPERLLEVVNASSGRNAATEGVAREVISRRFGGGFTVGLMAKDVATAADMAETLEMDAPLLARVRDLWREAEALLGGDVGTTEVVRLWEARNPAPDAD